MTTRCAALGAGSETLAGPRASRRWRRRTRSTSWATTWGSSRWRSSCSTAPTRRWRPPRCSSCARFLPALAGPWLTAAPRPPAVSRSLPALYVLEALAFAGLALIAGGTFALAAVLVLAFADGTLALTGRGLSRGAIAALLMPHGALREGNALLNVVFAIASGGGSRAGRPPRRQRRRGRPRCGSTPRRSRSSPLLLFARARPAAGGSRGAGAAGWRGARARRHRRRARPADPRAHRRPGGRLRLLLRSSSRSRSSTRRRRWTPATLGYGVLLAAWGVGIVLGSARLRPHARAARRAARARLDPAVGAGYLGLAAAPRDRARLRGVGRRRNRATGCSGWR